MKEKKLKVFVDSITRYFEFENGSDATVGSPFLIEDMSEVQADYTSAIYISGKYEGACFFSAPSALLRHLCLSFGETDTSDSMLEDVVGEVANTLSGNARKELGKDFMISPPRVTRGNPEHLTMQNNERIYAIPLNWKSYKATLSIQLS